MVLSILLSVPLATIAALNHGRLIDQMVRAYRARLARDARLLGRDDGARVPLGEAPNFPVAGWGNGFPGHVDSLFLPAITLALSISSLMVRSLRNSILETLARITFERHEQRSDGPRRVRLARAAKFAVVDRDRSRHQSGILDRRHDNRGDDFSIPGLGQLIVSAIFQRDYPVIQGVTLAIGIWSCSSISRPT